MAIRDVSQISEPAREVLRYFLARPSAVDSLEDIARWRLAQAVISRTVAETHDALELLMERGLVESLSSPATPRLYRLKPERIVDATSLLDSKQEPKNG